MAKEFGYIRHDPGNLNDDKEKVKIDENREKVRGTRLGTNPEPNGPKPEPGQDDD